MYKRKAVESAQTAADLKLHLDKYHAQLKEMQVAVSEKTSTLQQQTFKFKRIQVRAIIVVCLVALRANAELAYTVVFLPPPIQVMGPEVSFLGSQSVCPSVPDWRHSPTGLLDF